MKSPDLITVNEAFEHYGDFDRVLDARSPGEFNQDHLPGASNIPVLTDEERSRVGILYKESGGFIAKKIGAALVSRNIANALDGSLVDLNRNARLLVYCWRGGNRSGALATVLARVGWHTTVLDGGYRAFRRYVLDELRILPSRFRLIVIAGRTGSGKSLILERLHQLGAQVLDLERLARHRGSVLGHLPDSSQPSQRHFETLLWNALRSFDDTRPVLVESESRKIGQCQLPSELIEKMRSSACIRIEASDQTRCELLLAEYRHFVEDPEQLLRRLVALEDHHGPNRVSEWMTKAHLGDWSGFVRDLLHQHYDPAYDRSMRRNYRQIDESNLVGLSDASDAALQAAARRVLELIGELVASRPQ